MTWEIALIYLLLVGALVSFALEKIPADVTALTLMAVLIVTGLLPAKDALSVFANPAPLTVGAMFILSAALEKCGAIDAMARNLDYIARLPYTLCLLVMVLVVGGVSACASARRSPPRSGSVSASPCSCLETPNASSLAHGRRHAH